MSYEISIILSCLIVVILVVKALFMSKCRHVQICGGLCTIDRDTILEAQQPPTIEVPPVIR